LVNVIYPAIDAGNNTAEPACAGTRYKPAFVSNDIVRSDLLLLLAPLLLYYYSNVESRSVGLRFLLFWRMGIHLWICNGNGHFNLLSAKLNFDFRRFMFTCIYMPVKVSVYFLNSVTVSIWLDRAYGNHTLPLIVNWLHRSPFQVCSPFASGIVSSYQLAILCLHFCN